jgi:hypothetical protein
MRGRTVDRVECLWEPGVVLAGRVRETLGVPGLTAAQSIPLRDKVAMKQVIESAGLRTPRHARARSAKECREIAERFGYPLIIKPIAGAGSADTYELRETKDLEQALRAIQHVPEVTIEEFVDGEEHTFDTVCANGEILFENVRVPAANILLGEGRGFEIAQGRLGPGRIHHCMRAIGGAERALEMMCRRANTRVAFGGPLAEKQFVQEMIASSRMEIDQARLLVLHAAWKMDTVGKKQARQEISMIKVVAANLFMRVLDRAIQVHGALGVSDDTPLAGMWRSLRMLRLADGPDEVHKMVIARRELARFR